MEILIKKDSKTTQLIKFQKKIQESLRKKEAVKEEDK